MEYITDSEGKVIAITDLEKAIAKADAFRTMEHAPQAPDDADRKLYWQDIYDSLIKLKENNIVETAQEIADRFSDLSKITDIDEAIKEAEGYIGMFSSPSFERFGDLAKGKVEYWQEIRAKLLEMKKKP
jgi:hypothetical protein